MKKMFLKFVNVYKLLRSNKYTLITGHGDSTEIALSCCAICSLEHVFAAKSILDNEIEMAINEIDQDLAVEYVNGIIKN